MYILYIHYIAAAGHLQGKTLSRLSSFGQLFHLLSRLCAYFSRENRAILKSEDEKKKSSSKISKAIYKEGVIMAKLITAENAASLIKNRSTIAVCGFAQCANPCKTVFRRKGSTDEGTISSLDKNRNGRYPDRKSVV